MTAIFTNIFGPLVFAGAIAMTSLYFTTNEKHPNKVFAGLLASYLIITP